MTSPSTDRRYGLNVSAAIKVPCDCATTANITLNGEQSIDGVTTSESRVFVKNQTTTANNGIYRSDTGDWTREPDFDGARDIVTGTIITVNGGSTLSDTMWRVTNTGTITIGTTSLTFERAIVNDSASMSFLQNGTGAVTTTVQSKLRERVSILDFGTGTATDLSEAMASLTSGGTVIIPKGSYSFSGAITCSQANIKVQCDKGAAISWAGLGASTNAITVTANNFEWDGGVITGPSSAAYVADEKFISMTGTSSASRKTGLKVTNAEILNFGSDGVWAKWVSGVFVSGCVIHGIGYAGIQLLSCDFVRIHNNHIYTITPGSGGNMYGVTCTHNSTNYNLDPNAGTKSALNPFCWDVVISDNWIEDIAWIGIDFHGAYDSVVSNNRVYNTNQGIAVSSSSGAATNYAGWNNQVSNNLIDSRTSLGAVGTGKNLDFGINLNGGVTVQQSNVVCTGNIIYGHGILGNANSGSIQASFTKNAIIANNIIQAWGGNGIYYASAVGLLVTGNTILEIGGAAAGLEYGIGADVEVSSNTITQNTMLANGGTAGRRGYVANSLTTMPLLSQNNFSAATLDSYNFPAGFVKYSDTLPSYAYNVNNAGAGEVIDITTMKRYGQFRLEVSSSNASSTVTNLTGGVLGQIVNLYSPAATAWTFTRANAALGGGADFAATQYDTLVLQYNGTLWIELSRSANS